MNESLAIVTNRPMMNKNLQKATDKIREYVIENRVNEFAVAWIIGQVDAKQLYTDDGFESCAEWAMQSFGIQKTLAYELIGIGREFTMEVRNEKGKIIGYCSNLVDHKPNELPIIDYTTTKLGRMYKMGRDKVKALHDEGKIKPTMTFRDLMDFLKSLKPPKQNAVEPVEPIEPEPTEPAEPEPAEPAETVEKDIPLPDNAGPRQQGFDVVPSEYLIAELRARGFTVHRGNTEYLIDWIEPETGCNDDACDISVVSDNTQE